MTNVPRPPECPYLWWDHQSYVGGHGLARLDQERLTQDAAKQRLTLHEGMHAVLWEMDRDVNDRPELMLVNAVLTFDPANGRWWAEVDHESFRRAPLSDAPWLDDPGVRSNAT